MKQLVAKQGLKIEIAGMKFQKTSSWSFESGKRPNQTNISMVTLLNQSKQQFAFAS